MSHHDSYEPNADYIEDDEVIVSAFPTHPGTMLKDKLETLDLSATALAVAINGSRPDISKVLNGKLPVTAWLAARIEAAIGYPASILLTMQDAYDLAQIRRERADRLGEVARLVA